MKEKNYIGLIRTVLIIFLILLVLSVISNIAEFLLGDIVAKIFVGIILIIAVLWLLGKKGQKKIKKLLDEAVL